MVTLGAGYYIPVSAVHQHEITEGRVTGCPHHGDSMCPMGGLSKG